MKKYFLLAALFVVTLSSCKKATTFDVAGQAASDDIAIKTYISTYGITGAVKDPSGLYYAVVNAGTGSYPTSTSNVTVAYKGTLLDGTSFDSQVSAYFSLANVIKGWQIGIPHINKGGEIILLVPSALAYGDNATGTIPANSVLKFDITLQGFN